MRPAAARPRFSDWPDRLAAFLQSRLAQPFELGGQDCCMFAMDAVRAQTGFDAGARWRGRYEDEASAEALIGPGGLELAALAFAAECGLPEMPWQFAQRGDLVLVRWGNELLMAVVVGDRALGPGAEQLRSVPIGAAIRAWAV